MKLVYAPGACSLAVHILLLELGFPHTLQKVDLANKTQVKKINPKGYVPILIMNDGRQMTEAAPILQYLAELRPHSHLLPVAGSEDHFRTLEWLTFISTEIHKGVAPLFKLKGLLDSEAHNKVVKSVHEKLKIIEEHLGENDFFVTRLHTIADIYAFAIFGIIEHAGISLEGYPHIQDFRQRMEQFPAVKEALAEEASVQQKAA